MCSFVSHTLGSSHKKAVLYFRHDPVDVGPGSVAAPSGTVFGREKFSSFKVIYLCLFINTCRLLLKTNMWHNSRTAADSIE